MVDTSSESSLQQTESDKTDESSSQDAMTFRRQQNVSRDFADAFEINTETEQLEWYKAVRIAPWTNRFTKNGKVDEGMERMFWDQEAKSHQAILRSLTVFWMAFNILILLCDLHPLYYNDVKTPKVIKMNNFEDSRDVVLLLRLCIIFILLYAKVSRFFEGKDCSYLKSKWNLFIGMIAITIIEMILSIRTLDIEPGMHCILLLIMFNFTPIRLCEKAPICLALYVMWLVSYVLFCRGWEKDLDKLWRGPEEIQTYVVWVCESRLSQNLLAIKIGEAQSAIIAKRNKTNQMLLDSMLPHEITKELDHTDDENLSYVESYSDVTILFCVIDNFAEISSTFNAFELVSILNTVYSSFDEIADDVGSIYKVETVGEVYMMAGGCPSRTVHHATHAADMALAMIAAMPQIRVMLKQVLQNQTERAEREDDKLRILKNFNIKVGLNTGQVTAGVIGATCRRFKLFGDTVNTASRMESNSLPNFIQVSETTFKHLIKTRAFLFKKREPMKIKGKGIMQTYFLMGKTKDKDAVEHDVLENLMTQEDFVRFNFVDVCERVVEESKDQDESGDMIGSVVEMAESLKQPDASLRENGAHANTASNEGGARGVVQYDELNKSEAFMSTYTKLETREKPQLHVNQTLLFLFGYDFSVIKPGADEAMLETHYHLHVFVKHRVTVRFVFSAIFTMMVFLCGYDAWSLKHNMLILILRYSICLPFLAIFIIFSYHRRFFHFQQLSLFITWLVLGTSVVMIGTYEAPQPGYGILLIVLSVIFFLDSLYFINRLIIVFLLAILHCAMLYNSCVKYNTLERDREDDRLHHSDPLVHALKVDLSEIGKTFCVLMGDQICLNGHSNSREKTSCYVETFGENKTFYDQFVDDDDEADELENAVRTVLWRGLMKLQSVAPFPALRQVLIIFFFCCLLTYPNWLSDYFNRVCFNRVQKEYEMEKEGKQAQARTTKFLNQLVPPSIVPLLSQGKFIADKLDDATIIFVDMVGFTKFSSELDPDELVMFLNELYSRFDTVLDQFGLYKVEIIGDALFAVAGAPEERYDKYHAARAVCAANGLLQEVVKLRDFLEISIKIRIGIHTGSCVAGVVGIKDPRYHLFGVTCANAEMIESTGSAGRIHISQATADSIKESGASTGITFTKRDENDLPPLKADASDKERAERQQTVDNIDDARKRVGSSYFADVDVEMIMNFPDLQAVSDEGQHHPRMRRDTEDINFINRSSH